MLNQVRLAYFPYRKQPPQAYLGPPPPPFTHTHIYIHTYTHTYTHTPHTYTHTHINTHTHPHTYTHTHIHPHTWKPEVVDDDASGFQSSDTHPTLVQERSPERGGLEVRGHVSCVVRV